MSKTLVIVQDVPTQFDVPFYASLHAKANFSLQVFYTSLPSSDSETGHPPHWDHLENHVYVSHFAWSNSGKSVKTWSLAQLVHSILELKPAHVLISGYWPKLHRDLMSKLKQHGISVGVRVDNTLAHSKISGLRGWLKKLYLSRLLKQYDYWHPTGFLALEYLHYFCPANIEPAPKIVRFPYNVDNRWFAKHAADARVNRAELRRDYAISETDFLVLGVMKWHTREDPLTLIEAFKLFLLEHPGSHLMLVGDGPLKAQVIEACEPIKSQVTMPGYVPYSDLPALYGMSDVFVHPALREPWGVSINESLASGTPVIASDGVGSSVDLIQGNVNGSIFPQHNVQALSKCLSQWLQYTQDKEQQLLIQSCQQSLDNWNYQVTQDEFEKMLFEAT